MLALPFPLAVGLQPPGAGALTVRACPRLSEFAGVRQTRQLLHKRRGHFPVELVGHRLPLPELPIRHRLALIGRQILLPQPLIYPVQPLPCLLTPAFHGLHSLRFHCASVPETHTYQFTNPHPHNVSRTRQRSRRRALRIFCLAAIVVTMMMMGVSQCVVLSIDGHGHHFVAAVTAAAYISNPTRIDPFHFQSS